MELDLTGPVLAVAPRLLGALLSRGEVAVRLTEVEAYDGANDPASHAYRGPTVRNAVMFGPPGRLYVYFSYGMHHAGNVVCGPEGTAAAVLLRAGEVVAGRELARARRGSRIADRDLARGPGRLAQALGIDAACNGTSLSGGGLVTLLPGAPPARVSAGPRVGISVAADLPWRFWETGSTFVSAYKRSPRAGARVSEARVTEPGVRGD